MAIKQAKSGKKSKTVPKVQKKPKVVDEDVEMESDSDSDTSEEEVPVMVKPKVNSSPKKAKKAKVEEESEEDSEEEEEMPKKGGSIKVVKQAEDSDDDDDEEDDEEESEEAEEEQTKPKGKAPLAQMEEDDDEEDDDEEEDEVEEDEESEEESPKKQKVKAPKKKEEDEESDDEEEESEEESEEEESDGEVTEKSSKKRKAKENKKSAKKQKVEEIVTIKVSNIAESVSDEKLVKFLKDRGVETTGFRRNVKRGYGFLDLADPDTLSTAISLSGEKLKGSILTIEKAEAKQPGEKMSPEKGGKQLYGEEKDKLTLFMKNLPFEADEDKIKEVFPNATEVRLAKRPDGSLRGFGFVEFSTEEEVDAAMEANQGTEIGGRAVMLDFMGSKAKNRPSGGDRGDKSRSRGEAGKTKVLFVGNLSFDTTVESLKEAFEGCSDARIIYRDDGKSKGIGFVEYDSADDAKAALDSMTGAEVDGRQINLDFATERGSGGGGRGGFRGGRGGFRGGRGRGGGRGGRGGFGDRRGGGGFRGGRGGTPRRDGFQNFQGKKKTFDD